VSVDDDVVKPDGPADGLQHTQRPCREPALFAAPAARLPLRTGRR